ncbi:hypothetical protein [Salinicola peritrichatus]|uniref:hypothetical protein n=1 Tax=Salinicola peritrichatus TaxID=1267424 RepID=UPI0013A66DC5|nr:hypothetical protein [Salinicola peritrichatus]
MANTEDRENSHTSSSYGSGAPGSTHGAEAGSANSSHQSDMKEKGRETADEVKHAARRKAEDMFERQKGTAAEQAEGLSAALRNMAKNLDEQDQRYFSSCASNMARCTDALSQRLREQNLGSLMGQVQGYSRRQPALFLGGAVAAGFFLARFFNSSQQHDSQQHEETNATQTDGGTASSGSNTATDSMDKSVY